MTSTQEIQGAPRMPAREAEGHKGTFGTVTIIGGNAAGLGRSGLRQAVRLAGQRVMIGAPALAANAALRGGAGLAVMLLPAPILASALTIAPSATGVALPTSARGEILGSDAASLLDELLPSTHCLAIGPGLGGIED
ncbi:MAG: hypothetical protein ACF8NJ_03155, partial [Phycisphaerales bacterium JB038]